MKLYARQLRQVKYHEVQKKIKYIKKQPIYFILENIYDTYNVGGLFRLADAVSAEKIYLCGQTEIPPNAKIKKASIGTDKIVAWEYRRTAKEAIDELKDRKFEIGNQKLDEDIRSLKKRISPPTSKIKLQTSNLQPQIIAIEQSPKSILYTDFNYSLPLALIFGNETFGILPETLALADQIVEIPMWGINKSLNVIVSAAIVSYWIMTKTLKTKH